MDREGEREGEGGRERRRLYVVLSSQVGVHVGMAAYNYTNVFTQYNNSLRRSICLWFSYYTYILASLTKMLCRTLHR